jgi:hypothetical protein
MLEYCAGFVVFSLLFISKYSLSRVLVTKKQVALSLITIVTSELFMLLLIYISIDKYDLSGIRIVIGFVLATALGFAAYGIKSFFKK